MKKDPKRAITVLRNLRLAVIVFFAIIYGYQGQKP